MLDAVRNGSEQRRRSLYEQEAPIALQTSVLANINRDPKRQKEPYKLTDYSLYVDKRDLNLPDGAYGSAALLAVKQNRFPSWALFCFKELSSQAKQGYKPSTAALVCEDAILLHPVASAGGYKGLLIALESASLKSRTFTDDNGKTYSLNLPEIHTKVIAQEDVTLFHLATLDP